MLCCVMIMMMMMTASRGTPALVQECVAKCFILPAGLAGANRLRGAQTWNPQTYDKDRPDPIVVCPLSLVFLLSSVVAARRRPSFLPFFRLLLKSHAVRTSHPEASTATCAGITERTQPCKTVQPISGALYPASNRVLRPPQRMQDTTIVQSDRSIDRSIDPLGT